MQTVRLGRKNNFQSEVSYLRRSISACSISKNPFSLRYLPCRVAPTKSKAGCLVASDARLAYSAPVVTREPLLRRISEHRVLVGTLSPVVSKSTSLSGSRLSPDSTGRIGNKAPRGDLAFLLLIKLFSGNFVVLLFDNKHNILPKL